MIHLQAIVSSSAFARRTKIGRARDLPGVNNTRNPTQDGQTDVDQEIAVATGFEKDCKRRQEECQEV